MITIGIDPGAKYTGVSVRDKNIVLLSSTYVRPDTTNIVSWAVEVVKRVHEEIRTLYPTAAIGIEGVTVPNAYNQGKLTMLSPKYIIYTGILVGAFANQYPEAVIVRPGKNGSQATGTYPPELSGRRPKTLQGESKGAGTRNHEKSAWDIAGEVEFLKNQGNILDQPNNKKDKKL